MLVWYQVVIFKIDGSMPYRAWFGTDNPLQHEREHAVTKVTHPAAQGWVVLSRVRYH